MDELLHMVPWEHLEPHACDAASRDLRPECPRPATPMAAAAPAEPAERAEPASYPVSREPSPPRTAEPASYPVSREQSPCAARRPAPAEAAPAPGRADRAEDRAAPEVPPTASQGSAAEEDAPGGEREDGAAQMAVPTVPDKGSLAQWAPLPAPDARIPTTVPVSKASAVGALPEDPAPSSKESVAPAVANPAEGNGCSEAGADEAYMEAKRAAEAVNISAQPNAVTEDTRQAADLESQPAGTAAAHVAERPASKAASVAEAAPAAEAAPGAERPASKAASVAEAAPVAEAAGAIDQDHAESPVSRDVSATGGDAGGRGQERSATCGERAGRSPDGAAAKRVWEQLAARPSGEAVADLAGPERRCAQAADLSPQPVPLFLRSPEKNAADLLLKDFHALLGRGMNDQALEQRLWAGPPKRLAPKRSKAKAELKHLTPRVVAAPTAEEMEVREARRRKTLERHLSAKEAKVSAEGQGCWRPMLGADGMTDRAARRVTSAPLLKEAPSQRFKALPSLKAPSSAQCQRSSGHQSSAGARGAYMAPPAAAADLSKSPFFSDSAAARKVLPEALRKIMGPGGEAFDAPSPDDAFEDAAAEGLPLPRCMSLPQIGANHCVNRRAGPKRWMQS